METALLPIPLSAPPEAMSLFYLQMVKKTAQGHLASNTEFRATACCCVILGKCLLLSGPQGPTGATFIAFAVLTNYFLTQYFHLFERCFGKLLIFEISNIYDVVGN